MFINRFRRQRGLTLIELIMFIVIVSVALVGVLTVFNVTTRSSADPMIRKQMLAIAEAVLEEVMLQPFTWCDPGDTYAAVATGYTTGGAGNCTTAQNTLAGRTAETEARGSNTVPLDNVFDYNNEAINSAISSTGTTPLLVPTGYSAIVYVVADATLGPTASPIATADAVLRITVTVCHATSCPSVGSDSITLEGYRTRHSPNMLP